MSGEEELAAQRLLGPLTRLDFARFSIASADPNRVHIEESVAASAGLPEVIGSGGILTGMLVELVSDWGGRGNLRKASIKMFRPLFAGVTLQASVSVVEEVDGLRVVKAEVRDRDQGTLMGSADITLARPGDAE